MELNHVALISQNHVERNLERIYTLCTLATKFIRRKSDYNRDNKWPLILTFLCIWYAAYHLWIKHAFWHIQTDCIILYDSYCMTHIRWLISESTREKSNILCSWRDNIFWAVEFCLGRKKKERISSLFGKKQHQIWSGTCLPYSEVPNWSEPRYPHLYAWRIYHSDQSWDQWTLSTVLFTSPTTCYPIARNPIDPITKSFNFCFFIVIVSFSNLVGHKQLSPKQQSHCFPRSLKLYFYHVIHSLSIIAYES